MKNEYKITKDLVMSWAKEYHLQSKAMIVIFILYCIAGLCALNLLVLLSIFGGDWMRWFIAVWLLVLVGYRLFFSRFVSWSNRYKTMARTYGVSEWIRTTEFTDDEIILTEHNSSSMKFRYEHIKRVKEKGNLVFIYLHDNIMIRLYKDAFVEGSWEECKAKIHALRKS